VGDELCPPHEAAPAAVVLEDDVGSDVRGERVPVASSDRLVVGGEPRVDLAQRVEQRERLVLGLGREDVGTPEPAVEVDLHHHPALAADRAAPGVPGDLRCQQRQALAADRQRPLRP